MNRSEKAEAIARAEPDLQGRQPDGGHSPVGLTVQEVTDLRRKIRAAGASYKVAKNRLTLRRPRGHALRGARPHVHGSDRHRLFQGSGRGGESRRGLAKDNEKLTIVGGALGGETLDVAASRLSPPCRPSMTLRGKIIGLLQAPATKIAGVLAAPAGQLARVFGGVRSQGRRREGGVSSSHRHHDSTEVRDYQETKMANLEKLVDDLSALTVLEAARAQQAARREVGRLAPPLRSPLPPPRRCRRCRSGRREDEFTVILAAAGDKKINVIKEVRDDHRPRPQGSQGPGRRRAEGRSRKACRRTKPRSSRRSSRPKAPRSSSSRRSTGPGRHPAGTAGPCGLFSERACRQGPFRQVAPCDGWDERLAGRELRDSSGCFAALEPTRTQDGHGLQPRKRIRQSLRPHPEVAPMPNLIEVQKSSYESFLQMRHAGRTSATQSGLQEVFRRRLPDQGLRRARQPRVREVRARRAEVRRRGVPAARHDLSPRR